MLISTLLRIKGIFRGRRRNGNFESNCRHIEIHRDILYWRFLFAPFTFTYSIAMAIFCQFFVRFQYLTFHYLILNVIFFGIVS